MAWEEDIKARFPDWGTNAALERWPSIRQRLSAGQTVRGEVIARAPFGVWIDVGVGHPALLLVPEIEGARQRALSFDDYPLIGTKLEARIMCLGDGGQISLTQHAEPLNT
jgi:predicted RNA-binding protein with RPS1 domain